MAGVGVNKSAEEINRLLVKYLPECESEYAKYPMNLPRWFEINEKAGLKGEPLVLKQPNMGVKKDYVFCERAPAGPAYYSLLCKVAYINLYSRHSHNNPTGCCACSAAARRDYDEWDDVKRIMHARHLAKVPTDNAAAGAAMDEARQTAQTWHTGLQNEALAHNVVNVGIAMGS